MLIRPTTPASKKESPRRVRRLWHDASRNTPSLGCMRCNERSICGALCLGASAYDCLHLCCQNPNGCDRVCPNNDTYVDRVREINGFDLGNVPHAPLLLPPRVPKAVPLVFHGNCRESALTTDYVALPLAKMFDRRTAKLKYASRAHLMDTFKIERGAEIILSGTDHDASIERWWGLQEVGRRSVIRQLVKIGVRLVTTPNYSLFLDRPRWDDLHSIKRIALVHSEFLDEGLPAALHVNGRSEADFQRWTDFLVARPEVTDIAYEFTTGARWSQRRVQHAKWLCKLARDVRRPLRIIIRGGSEILPLLVANFAQVSVITSTAFMKTMKRRLASPLGNSRLEWLVHKTPQDAVLDELMASNVETVNAWLTDLMAVEPPAVRANGTPHH